MMTETGSVSDAWRVDAALYKLVFSIGGAVGAPAPPRAEKKIFFRPNLQENVLSAPTWDTKCTPSQSKSKFLGQFMLGGLDWRYI